MCEPDGLSVPDIFAFFISVSDMFDLYSSIVFRLFVSSSFSRYTSICLSKTCMSAEYASVCPSSASWIFWSSSAIFSFRLSSLLL